MKTSDSANLFIDSVELLKKVISIPSFSNEEEEVATVWEEWLGNQGVKDVKRFHNNVYALTPKYDPCKPILLLNSHIDTVKPVSSYTRNPFEASIDEGKLWGLGSNDAGASGVSLAATFLALKDLSSLKVNLLLALTSSEEKMGEFGMRAFLPHLSEIGLYPDMAIVGEPTSLQPAIAERGLVVLDGVVNGEAGHAARNTGKNAINLAMQDLIKISNLELPEQSDTLGKLNFNVTMINAGTQHNIIPDRCTYVIDVRTTDAYPNEVIANIFNEATDWTKFTARSTRIKPSVLSRSHPLYHAVENLGLIPFVSPTTSDMALMHDIPSLKIGPGDSRRSHTADEFVYLAEIKEAMELYPKLINLIN